MLDDVVELCVASYQNDVARVSELVQWVPVDTQARQGNVRGYTALTAACGFTVSDTVALVLLTHGADPDLTNAYGRTPLMCAVINSNAAAAELLLKSGASLELRHKNQMTALDYARLAVMESGVHDRQPARQTEAVLLRWRAQRRLRALARHARVLAIGRHFEAHLLLVQAEVLYRPGGRGACESRDEFETLLARHGGGGCDAELPVVACAS